MIKDSTREVQNQASFDVIAYIINATCKEMQIPRSQQPVVAKQALQECRRQASHEGLVTERLVMYHTG